MKNYEQLIGKRAEKFLKMNLNAIKELPNEDIRSLIEELHIHRIELEVQNQELRRAQLELEAARNRYSDLYDFAPVGYITISEDELILEANLTSATLLGIERNLLIGQPFKRFIAYDDQDVFYLHRKKLFETKIRKTCELKLKKKDGTLFYAQLDCILVEDVEENITQIRASITDVNERKKIEEDKKNLDTQIRQSSKIEAIGTLAGGIAHDFNNLMMAMLGNVSLMLDETESAHPHCERLKNVERLIRSGSTLTSQLLGFARKGKYEVKPISLNQIVKASSEAFGRTRKEITIYRELAEHLSVVEADQNQIQQVILNLYFNAADAMPGGGDLFLQTMNVTHTAIKDKLHDPKPGNYAMIKITDKGAGMDENTMERIFDPFFTTKEMCRGTGLGLASVYGIIKGHGGYIDVDSKKGFGTTFSIFLPASDEKVTEVSEVSERIEKGTETILLVDREILDKD